jgi:hypothetical protein
MENKRLQNSCKHYFSDYFGSMKHLLFLVLFAVTCAAQQKVGDTRAACQSDMPNAYSLASSDGYPVLVKMASDEARTTKAYLFDHANKQCIAIIFSSDKDLPADICLALAYAHAPGSEWNKWYEINRGVVAETRDHKFWYVARLSTADTPFVCSVMTEQYFRTLHLLPTQ